MQLFSHSKLEKRSYLRMHPFFRYCKKFFIVSLSKDFRLIKKFITPGGVESCTSLVHITSAFTICFLLCCASGAAHDSSRQIYAHTQFQLTVTWYTIHTQIILPATTNFLASHQYLPLHFTTGIALLMPSQIHL